MARQLGVTTAELVRYLRANHFTGLSASSAFPAEALSSLPTKEMIGYARHVLFPPGDAELNPPWPPLVTTSQASHIVGVRPSTIRQWVKRGHLTRVEGLGKAASSVFKVEDVLAARAATQSRSRSEPSRYALPPLKSSDFERCLTAHEAGWHLNIPASTIRSWAHRGHLLAVGNERHATYRLSDIYVFIARERRLDVELIIVDAEDWEQ